MHRTTIMLPVALKQRARGLARRLGMSLSELIRESLEARLTREADEVREDALYADEAVWDGAAPADLAAEHDEHLYGRGRESG